ncbi:DNA polymerase I [Enterococcus saccharolyticus]|uniref:DNA polymerase I n=1 Tax=Enterococcus saccharolyticus subsp. saccharolyticus ATCC 43076 TaxID=1139996 RepID=S0JMM6_9ENTE|nr:DNA polymerase I [Enterococcus saccharolyticus]EOT29118.1 DNA polymerase I [Enterococcus saccharolyticus subsp. saccharolyticus ATCC 43076]EOT80917.1 DNA polymerase I [Enterococcus saccharolyticus subsp. saccharolyticus ATCC 43076]OJG89624.1 DNA polymerase I [Enterococcus saccharolyticus]
MTKNKLLLVDGNSVAFRAFFALHNSLERFKNNNGLHTNAIYAFNNMFENVMAKEAPTHVLVAFDAGKTTFRNAMYEEYKGGRAKTPGEFKEQMPYIRELINGLGVKHYELDNYEADDIIGTLANRVDKEQFDVVILTGDRDLTQLATEQVKVDITVKGVSDIESYTPEHIAEKYDGLTPLQIIDMKGLAGDASDNIPGVTKIGEKTAIKLLKQYDSVEGIYEHIDEMKKSKMKENLINDRELAFLSKQLATINIDAPVEVDIDSLKYEGKDLDKLVPFYKEMNFKTFLERLNVVDDQEMTDILFEVVEETTPEMFTEESALYIEMLGDNYHIEDIVGIAWGTKEKIYVARNEAVFEDAAFQDWLFDETKKKKVYDAKRTQVALNRYIGRPKGLSYDVLLAAYLLDTNDNSNDIAAVAAHYGYTEIQSDDVVYGRGAKKGLPEDEEVFFAHLARKIVAIDWLSEKLVEELEEKGQTQLFYEIEFPLSNILAEMEITGIKVDAQRLNQMKGEFAERLHEIEQKIYAQAGEEFNLNSPKQLGVILFEKMGLPVIKKTKTGYSTAVDVLEQLKEQAPIVEDILVYRQISKIQSTYVEGLLKMIQGDGKIHTRYVQTLTQTGRLSSVDPNLQNIPIRLEEGRKIREAFVPRKEDWVIYSSDYSQIELRVLAHISDDEHLKAAFLEGQDIHSSTAMRVFGIEKAEDVTPNMRRQAKAVNFGIVYGISDYGLSQNLGITRKAAQQYIDTYFDRYPGVKEYMETVVREAKDKGYIETLYHRRRYLPDINSRNFNLRSFAERTAINSPIQGSAADILKIAMIELDRRMKEEKLEATMLLQVHDELVFEVPESELEQLNQLVKEVMETAVSLHVPLVTDSSWGKTWYEAK